MRRSQAKSHCPILSKVMDVEESEVKIAVVDFAPDLKTKKAGRKIEASEKHCS